MHASTRWLPLITAQISPVILTNMYICMYVKSAINAHRENGPFQTQTAIHIVLAHNRNLIVSTTNVQRKRNNAIRNNHKTYLQHVTIPLNDQNQHPPYISLPRKKNSKMSDVSDTDDIALSRIRCLHCRCFDTTDSAIHLWWIAWKISKLHSLNVMSSQETSYTCKQPRIPCPRLQTISFEDLSDSFI
jgi:hypothetical protein